WAVARLVVGRDWRKQLALRLPTLSHAVLAVLALPGIMLTSQLVYLAAHRWLPTFNYQQSMEELFGGWPLWASILIIGIGPGVMEELWFRGFLGRGLVGSYGRVAGVLLTSLFFGLMHLDPPHVVVTFVIGAALHVT